MKRDQRGSDRREPGRATAGLGRPGGCQLSGPPAGEAGAVLHAGRFSGQANLYGPGCSGHPPGGHRSAGPVSLHPRSLSHHVSGTALDHAPDRGLRHRRRYQQALQVPDPAGPDGAVHRFRHAYPDGVRLRPCHEPGRGGAGRSGHRHPVRHGGPLCRHRPGKNLGFDDHQPLGLDPAGHVRGPGREARVRPRSPVGDDSGRHAEGVHGPEGMDLSHCSLGADRQGLHRLLRGKNEALQPGQHLRVPHQ